jgi:pyruvate dehydrogenase E2 component (dihydrolipoamide acetyltransferase)
VEIRKYVAAEGSVVAVGAPVAVIENYWAVMTLKANGKGILKKAFFERRASVKVGDPIAIIGADGENIPCGKPYALVEVSEWKRQRPQKMKPSATER